MCNQHNVPMGASDDVILTLKEEALKDIWDDLPVGLDPRMVLQEFEIAPIIAPDPSVAVGVRVERYIAKPGITPLPLPPVDQIFEETYHINLVYEKKIRRTPLWKIK